MVRRPPRSTLLPCTTRFRSFFPTRVSALSAPRIHLENDMLSFEEGFSEKAIQALESAAPKTHEWVEKNLFFGGVHIVSASPDGHFDGAGDPRRGGAVSFAR